MPVKCLRVLGDRDDTGIQKQNWETVSVSLVPMLCIFSMDTYCTALISPRYAVVHILNMLSKLDQQIRGMNEMNVFLVIWYSESFSNSHVIPT